MPWFSFHGGHSGTSCRHASDTLEQVVEAAINAGFTHYGLSEHCPRYRSADLYDDERATGVTAELLQEDFAAYLKEAARLQKAHQGSIDLIIGLETERLPPGEWKSRMTSLRADVEYIVGSVHDVDGVFIDVDPRVNAALAETLGGVEALQLRYFEGLLELVGCLQPEVIGHIDLIRRFDGAHPWFSPRVMAVIEELLKLASSYGGVLDVNCGASRYGFGPVFPMAAILHRARQLGVGVTLGDDSHGVRGVGAQLRTCVDAIVAAGYRQIHYLAHEGGDVRWCVAPISEVRPQPPQIHNPDNGDSFQHS